MVLPSEVKDKTSFARKNRFVDSRPRKKANRHNHRIHGPTDLQKSPRIPRKARHGIAEVAQHRHQSDAIHGAQDARGPKPREAAASLQRRVGDTRRLRPVEFRKDPVHRNGDVQSFDTGGIRTMPQNGKDTV